MARTNNVGRRIDGIIHGRTVQSRAIPGFARILMLAALPVVYGAAAFQLVGQAQAPAILKSAPSPYSASQHLMKHPSQRRGVALVKKLIFLERTAPPLRGTPP